MSKSPSERPRSKKARARLEAIDKAFAALAHEQRRHILLTLHFRGGSLSAGAIAERFSCAWPTTTRHLNVLVDASLISVERKGRERIYHLERDSLQRAVGDWLSWFENDVAPPR
ncbi:MAG: metalloregulator ArsR/SmtB family transcription factor [Myxococcota bacterium]